MLTAATLILFAVSLIPLAAAGTIKKMKARHKKIALLINIACVAAMCAAMLTAGMMGVSASDLPPGEAEAAASKGTSMGAGIGMLAAALATGLSCLGGGIAVASSASAAIGAISENSKMFGRALIFVALAEGIALYGLLISIQILAKI